MATFLKKQKSDIILDMKMNLLKNHRASFGLTFFLTALALFFLHLTPLQIIQALSEKDVTPPRTPQNFSVRAEEGRLEIAWQENLEWDIFSYLLYVRTGDEKEAKKPILTGKTDRFILENLKSDTIYYLSLAANDIAGNESKPTSEIGISPYQPRLEKNFSIAAWMPGQNIEEGQKSLEKNLDLFDQISPFEYKVEKDGEISRVTSVLTNDLKEKLKSRAIKIIPSITNNFDENDKASNILRDERKRKAHLDYILNEVKEQGYDGIDLDYENLKEETKEEYSRFIEELSSRLHAEGKILSVTLQAKNSDYQTWRGPGALDYEKIARHADQVRLMTYDYSRPDTSPGPISPISWFEQIIDYAQEKAAKEKIIVGLPFYGYRWCLEKVNDDCQSKGLVFEGVKNIVEKYKPEVKWNEETKSRWFLYEDENKNKYALNFEDNQSLEEKLRVIKDEEVGGVVIWRLGGEDAENFDVLRRELLSPDDQPKNIKVRPDNRAIHLEWENPQNKDLKGYRLFLKSREEDGFATENKSYAHEESFDVLGESSFDLENLQNDQAHYINFQPLLWSEDVNPTLTAKDAEKSFPVLATPQDLIYPSPVLDLKIEEVDTTTLKLSFTSSGDDKEVGKASAYDLRFSLSPLNNENFERAQKFEKMPKPKEAREKEEVIVPDLIPGETYYLGLRIIDEAENFSEISNVVKAETVDNIPPRAPNFSVLPENQALKIIFDKSREKDLASYKIYFKQEKSYYQMIEIDSTEATSYTIKNLENGYRYFVAMTSYDRHGNESGLSESKEGTPSALNFAEKTKNLSTRAYDLARGQALIFGQRVISQEAIPYLVMFSVIILNFVIYVGLKGEIKRKVPNQAYATSPVFAKEMKKNHRPKVIDLKKGRMVLK